MDLKEIPKCVRVYLKELVQDGGFFFENANEFDCSKWRGMYCPVEQLSAS